MKKSQISLRTQVMFIVLFTFIPVMILMFWVNQYSMNLIQQQIYKSQLDILTLNIRQLEGELEKTATFLRSISTDESLLGAYASNDETDQYFAAVTYSQDIQDSIIYFDYVEGILCYAVDTGKTLYCYTDYSSSYLERMSVIDEVKEQADELSSDIVSWSIYSVNDKYFLLCSTENEGVLFCAWTSFDTLMLSTGSWDSSAEGSTCFISQEGEFLTAVAEELQNLDYSGDLDNYYFSGGQNQYLMLGVDSSLADFRLMSTVDRHKALGIFYIIRIVSLIIIVVFALFFFPFCLYSLNRSLFRPLWRIWNGMGQVEKGNLDVQVENPRANREIMYLTDSFNDMTGQIKTLKIQSYEDALQKQQLEMDYMQLQIEPHFYLNALNLISAMAQAGDTDLICQLADNLALYLRYLANARNKTVTIADEAEHINQYMQIMKIRFEDSFCYEQDIDESAKSIEIPPLLFQIVIENSMKYAFDIYGQTVIRLSVKCKEQSSVEIEITDNGDGYPDEILKCFRMGVPPEGNHIGLWNIKSRLEAMYPGSCEFQILNQNPKGACTRMQILIGQEADN